MSKLSENLDHFGIPIMESIEERLKQLVIGTISKIKHEARNHDVKIKTDLDAIKRDCMRVIELKPWLVIEESGALIEWVSRQKAEGFKQKLINILKDLIETLKDIKKEEEPKLDIEKIIKPFTKIEVMTEGKVKELVHGGLADEMPDSAFDPKQLAMGIRIELEHTNDINLAKEIAKDHLAENPKYYKYLSRMEKSIENKASTAEGHEKVNKNDIIPKISDQECPRNKSLKSLTKKRIGAESGLSQQSTQKTIKENTLTSLDTMLLLPHVKNTVQKSFLAKNQTIAESSNSNQLEETTYKGKKVKLNKPFRTPDGPKKFSVYVKNKKGNVVKVNFGDPKMKIKYVNRLVGFIDKDAGDKYSDITERDSGKISCPTKLKLFRATKEIPPSEIDPLHRGTGIFGDGTYYALDKETSLGYANDSVYSIVSEYDFSFDRVLCLQNGENVTGLGRDRYFTVNDKELSSILKPDEDNSVHGSDLISRAEDAGYNAVALRGTIDGGEQVIVSNDSYPAYKLTKMSVISPDRNLLVKVSRACGNLIRSEPITGQFIISDIPPSKASKIEGILIDYSEEYRKKIQESVKPSGKITEAGKFNYDLGHDDPYVDEKEWEKYMPTAMKYFSQKTARWIMNYNSGGYGISPPKDAEILKELKPYQRGPKKVYRILKFYNADEAKNALKTDHLKVGKTVSYASDKLSSASVHDNHEKNSVYFDRDMINITLEIMINSSNVFMNTTLLPKDMAALLHYTEEAENEVVLNPGSFTAKIVDIRSKDLKPLDAVESNLKESKSIHVFYPEQVADSLKRGGREFESDEDLMDEAQYLAEFLNSFPSIFNVYRVVHADSEDDVDTDLHIGEHWTHTDRKAIDFASNNLRKPWFLISGKVRHGDVDWAQTLFQNVHHPHEEEIHVRKKKSVRVTSIEEVG